MLATGVGAVCVAVACVLAWPKTARTEDPPAKPDSIEQRLDKIEKALSQIDAKLDELKGRRKGWEKLKEAKGDEDYLIIMDTETGKVKYINKSDPSRVFEK
jgi:hypothetical protein